METLFENKELMLEHLDNGNYRITMFNKDCHWSGDFAFNEEKGIIYDDLTPTDEKENLTIYNNFS